MKVAFVGSCFCEEFLGHVLPQATLVLRHFRINTISLMDDHRIDLGDLTSLSADSQRHLNYENRKDFRERLAIERPDLLLLDFVRDVRCPVLTDGTGYISYPYELLTEQFETRNAMLAGLDLVPFGSETYSTLHRAALDRMCSFLNKFLPDTRVLILNFGPTWDYRGLARTQRDFRTELLCWQLRKPILDSIAAYCASILRNGTVLEYDGPIWNDDEARYGSSAMHYARGVWQQMANRFDVASLSFRPSDAGYAEHVARDMAAAFRYFEEDAQDIDQHWRSLDRSGADVLSEIMPAMMEEIAFKRGMMRRPTLVEAYNAFYWILGRWPENMPVLLQHATEPTVSRLRRRLLASEEFRGKLADWTAPDPPAEPMAVDDTPAQRAANG